MYRSDKGTGLPFECMIVPGVEAVEICLKIRNDKTRKVVPVMLGDEGSVEFLMENYEFCESAPESILESAKEFIISEFIERRSADDPELFEEIRGDWPDEEIPSSTLTAHIDVMSGDPFKKVYIGLIPTDKPYEAPDFLRYGNWNDCPSADEHVGIHKYWFEKYGAEIISITGDVIECTVKNPPKTREEALHLANEQFLYCTDIITQGVGTIEALAAMLINANYWYFWWD